MDYQSLRNVCEVSTSFPAYMLLPTAAVIAYEIFRNVQDSIRIHREEALEDSLD